MGRLGDMQPAPDVLCPDGSTVGPGAFCASQAPITSGLPVAYGAGSSPVAVPLTLTSWLNSNSTLVAAGAGALVLLMLLKGVRR